MLQQALTSTSFVEVMAAADTIAELALAEYQEPLESTLERFLALPAKSDPGCLAKAALATALYRCGGGSLHTWRRTAHHVQMEPVWGKSVDTAGNLRSIAASAMIESRDPTALLDVADLLADPLAETRSGTARALGSIVSLESELLLRLKVLLGDVEPSVICDCLGSLARCNPERSIDFLAKWLDSARPELRESAALALGETHLPRALALLLARWEKELLPESRRQLVQGIAVHRSEESFRFLCRVIVEADLHVATAAVRALGVFAADPLKRDEVGAAVRNRDNSDLTTCYRNTFGL